MKKTYIQPSMAIAEVELESVIATSPLGTNDVVGNKSILSNDRDSYDEEEEDLW